MKKVLSLFIICAVLTVSCPHAALANSNVVSRLLGLGIIQGDDRGFREDDNITRAEFCLLLARILRFDEFHRSDTGFSDVPSEHWASGCIAAISGWGIINGNGDGTFGPDDNVTFNQAVKMLVETLGYGIAAKEAGGYPNGYTVTAANLGLIKGISAADEAITRLTAAIMINNALDIVPLEVRYGTDTYERNRNNSTLYDIITDKWDVAKVEGILTANKYANIEENDDINLKSGYIKIDGVRYKSGNDFSEYIGYRMEGYARYDEREDIYVIVNLEPSALYNKIVAANAENSRLFDNYLEYDNPNGTGKRLKFNFSGDVMFVYNGKVVSDEDISSIQSIYYGQYRAIDNTRDSVADIVFIEEAESFIVEKTNKDNATVYFMNRQYYRGKSGFIFEFYDEDKIYEIKDAAGNELTFDDIEPGQGITFIASRDEDFVKVLISDEKVSGVIESIANDEGLYTINDQEYKLALNPMGENDFDVRLGDEVVLVLDVYGNIAGIYGDKTVSFQYGYVLDAGYADGLSSALRLRVVSGAPPVKEEKVESGNTKITYYFQNDIIRTYECVRKVRFMTQGTSGNLWPVDVLQSFEQTKLIPGDLKGTIVGFSTNADGKIDEIYVFPLPADNVRDMGQSTFNARDVSFGGESVGNTVGRGYTTNSQTAFICVPNAPVCDDDYYVQIRMTDNSSPHYVYGTKTFFSPVPGNISADEKKDLLNAQPVDVLVIKKDMDTANPPSIPEGADVCIVGNIAMTLGNNMGDDETVVYKLELLNKNNRIEEYTSASGAAFETANTLVAGDLIKYTKDGFGRIARLERVGRIQGLGDVYNESADAMYGAAMNIELNTFDYMYNRRVDNLMLDLGEYGVKLVRVPLENGPAVYMYDRGNSGFITSATTEDIRTLGQVGDDASKIYVYSDADTVRTVVIIKD